MSFYRKKLVTVNKKVERRERKREVGSNFWFFKFEKLFNLLKVTSDFLQLSVLMTERKVKTKLGYATRPGEREGREGI